ncbi:hypothetical protein L1887_03256 [Cichorium endivia]|nr:hypothetical protein L1887_03256 [Cichorium endivia]
MSSSQRVEDVEELMHHIQSRLPVKEAARTSVLSKSWLQAWSTIPTLRFHVERRRDMKLVVERTLIRYLRDNIPIQTFDLYIVIYEDESASLAEECIRATVATKTLKELSLSIYPDDVSVNLPNEILSCENLTKMRVSSFINASFSALSMTSHQPVTVNCISLRELDLRCVYISQELLDAILSFCRLLVKVRLAYCSEGLNSIKVKNLPCLEELVIMTIDGGSTALEINNVPKLRFCRCNLDFDDEWNPRVPSSAHSISIGSRLAHLSLCGVVMDDASLNMIEWGVPFLEGLNLHMTSWKLESFRFTCASIKRLSLLCCRQSLIDVQVYAPNLRFFSFDGHTTMPSLLFPVSTLIKQTRFSLNPGFHFDASFFLKMREALAISSNCYININLDPGPPPGDIDIDDIRARLPFPPAMNVRQLTIVILGNRSKWEYSPFIDAFFEICHPKHVSKTGNFCSADKNYFCNLMLKGVLEEKKKTTTTASWPGYLKRVQIRHRQKWETLKDSHRSFLEGATPFKAYFKLKWR